MGPEVEEIEQAINNGVKHCQSYSVDQAGAHLTGIKRASLKDHPDLFPSEDFPIVPLWRRDLSLSPD